METIAGDRRSSSRYEIRLPLQYGVIRRKRMVLEGSGETCNLSSGGIAFVTRELLPVDRSLQLLIDWPVPSQEGFQMKLIVFGRVARSDEQCTAVRITHYEFRTSPEPLDAAGPELASQIPGSSALDSSIARVTVYEARMHFSRLLRRVEKGETILICRYSTPVAEMRPLARPAGKPRVLNLESTKPPSAGLPPSEGMLAHESTENPAASGAAVNGPIVFPSID